MIKQYLKFAAVLAAVTGSPALAQSTGEGSETAPRAEGGIADIVVTARRTGELLQSTPVAVSAFGDEALERAQVVDVGDLQGKAPSLSIGVGGTSAPTQAQLAIRGQAQNSPGTNSDPAVGIYVDGVYLARPVAANVAVLDIDRVEVLRGPQGTLFGRNTIGGALNITTKRPTGEFEGLIRAGIGNYDHRRIEAVLNVPLNGDELAVRGVFRYQERDGYGRFVRLDDRPASDIKSDYYGRMAIRWAPASVPLTVTVNGDYSRYRDSGQQQTLIDFNENFLLAPGFTIGDALAGVGIDPQDFVQANTGFRDYFGYANTGKAFLDTPYDDGDAKGISATVELELGDVTIKSITSYRDSLIANVQDLSGLPANLVAYRSRYEQDQFTQEINLSASLGNLDVIGGVFYFVETGDETTNQQSFGFLNPGGPQAQVVSTGTDGDVRNRSVAAYIQANYWLTDRLRATAGFRYTWDNRKVVMHSLADRDDPSSCTVVRDVPGGPCDQTRQRGFDYPAWTFGLDYEASDDLFLYAKTSGASMAGGFNIRGTITPPFEPETVRDVEVGLKADFFDRRLRTNLAAFYAWQSKVQRIVNAYDPDLMSITQYIQNAGKARTYGVEFEGTALLWEGMEVTGSLALLDAAYTEFTGVQLVGNTPVTVDRSDETVPQAPDLTFAIGATQELPVGPGMLSLHADFAYVSDRVYYQDTASPLQPPEVQEIYARANEQGTVDGHGLLNARITYELPDLGLEFELWGRNLTDKEYYNIVSTFYTSFGPAIGYPGAPRTYGLSVAKRF